MYLDGGAYGVNKVSFYWNYARIFLDKRVTQILTGATIAFIIGYLGASAVAFSAGVLGTVGFIASELSGAIRNGMWFDVNYFYFGKITKFGWQ